MYNNNCNVEYKIWNIDHEHNWKIKNKNWRSLENVVNHKVDCALRNRDGRFHDIEYYVGNNKLDNTI